MVGVSIENVTGLGWALIRPPIFGILFKFIWKAGYGEIRSGYTKEPVWLIGIAYLIASLMLIFLLFLGELFWLYGVVVFKIPSIFILKTMTDILWLILSDITTLI